MADFANKIKMSKVDLDGFDDQWMEWNNSDEC